MQWVVGSGMNLVMSSERLRQPFEGQLYKYTNVMKGWQYRWFILDPESGILEYYVADSERKQRPRGSVHLAGAVIAPSDEDSHTFTVNSASGEVYKLRASDARERQEWVTRLRAVAEMHTQAIAHVLQSIPAMSSREGGSHHSSSQHHSHAHQSRITCSLSVLDAFKSVREFLQRSEQNHYSLAKAIEEMPGTGNGIKCTDMDLLLMKATSQATLVCLEQCLSVLHHQMPMFSGAPPPPPLQVIQPHSPQPQQVTAPPLPASDGHSGANGGCEGDLI